MKRPKLDHLDRAAFLGGVRLFAGLPVEDLRALASIGQLDTWEGGSVLFREGDPGEAMFVVVVGRARMTREVPGEEDVVLAEIGAKDFFGEMALFDDVRRTATARVDEGWLVTLRLERDAFLGVVRAHPTLALHLVAVQGRRLRAMSDRFTEVDRRARRYAPNLEELIEEEYPHPIAMVHEEWMAAADAGTSFRRMLEVLESILLYVSAVSKALYCAFAKPDPAVDEELLIGQKSPTMGHQIRIVRLISLHLGDRHGEDGLAGEIDAWLDREGPTGKTGGALVVDLIEVRNAVKHGSEASLHEDAYQGLVREHGPKVTALCATLDFLRRYPLVYVNQMTHSEGTYRYALQVCRGAFRSFRTEAWVHDQPLDTHRLYVLDRERTRPVPLHPWAVLARCETCGERDVFLTQRWTPKALHGIELGRGHRHVSRDPGLSVERLEALLRARVPPTG